MTVSYQNEAPSAADFAGILDRSGLGARRPVGDLQRLQRMIDGADIIITARDGDTGALVGIARSLTDWSYACYLADLAVDRSYQGQGIGQRLIDLTREQAGEQSFCLLLAAPDAETFYAHIGMPRAERAFMYPRSE